MKKGAFAPFFKSLQTSVDACSLKAGAGNEARTRDLNLGKVALYQLSYSRKNPRRTFNDHPIDHLTVIE